MARSAAVMGIATFLSRIAGLVREQTFAYLFGAGTWTDAFNVAFRIPNLLRELFAEGAMSAAFVPTFNAILRNEGRDRAFRLTNLTINTILLVVGALTILGIWLTPLIVGLLAPEFRNNPEQFAATVTMTRIMFPFMLAVSLAAIAMGILNSLGEFFIPAIAPVFLNLAMILAGFFLGPVMGRTGWPPISSMAVGALLGGFLQLGAQVPALWRNGFRFRLETPRRDPGLIRIIRLIIPGTIGLAAAQINVAISTMLATSAGSGAVSWLSYAFRVMQLPLGIFGVAIAQATLPVVSRQAADKDASAMAKTLAGSIRLALFINLFCLAGLIALAQPVIRVLFQHGRFTAADSAATALALQAFAGGILFTTIVKILGPAFYALNQTRIPVVASIMGVSTNIALNLLLVKSCGYWGLALGTTLGAFVNSAILLVMMHRRLGRELSDTLPRAAARSCLAAVLSAVGMALLNPFFQRGLAAMGMSSPGFMQAFLGLALTGVAGIIILAVLARLLGITEASRAWELLLRRLGRRRPQPASDA